MNHLILLAAGRGQRMNARKDKLLMEAGGKPLIYYSIMAFHDRPDIENIVIVANNSNKKEIEKIINTYRFPRIGEIVIGGLSRFKSLEKGLKAIAKKAKKDDLVIVHNAANPLVSQKEIDEALLKAGEVGACITGHYISSTVKEIDDNHIIKTHNREKLFAAQTPQIAKFGILEKAVKSIKKKSNPTDEAMLLEAIGQKVAYTEADPDNYKITTAADLLRLRLILGDISADFRIGIGQDSHTFEESQKGLVLGGLELKNELKLQANSDGDVILHAVFNAISQALGAMSLGFYADEICEKGVTDSKKYLEIILKKMKKQKFKVNSLGLMIECKTPKIDPLVGKLKKSLATLLDLAPTRIGIIATSGEELTLFGQGFGIQCFAIVSLRR